MTGPTSPGTEAFQCPDYGIGISGSHDESMMVKKSIAAQILTKGIGSHDNEESMNAKVY